MAKLSPEDRKLAESQVCCAIDQDSPLGSMGPILKVMAKGQPVFVCCRGCESEVRSNPDQARSVRSAQRQEPNCCRRVGPEQVYESANFLDAPAVAHDNPALATRISNGNSLAGLRWGGQRC